MPEATTKNKIEYGLKNLYLALLTEADDGKITWGTPFAVPGAVSLTQQAVGDSQNIYGDDTVYYTHSTNNGYEGSVNIVMLTDDVRTKVFGEEEYAAGQMVELTDVKQKRFAMLFECSGDQKNARHIMYDVSFKRGDVEHKTVEDSMEHAEFSMDYTARPIRLDDEHLAVKERIEQGSTKYSTVFTAAPTKPTKPSKAAA